MCCCSLTATRAAQRRRCRRRAGGYALGQPRPSGDIPPACLAPAASSRPVSRGYKRIIEGMVRTRIRNRAQNAHVLPAAPMGDAVSRWAENVALGGGQTGVERVHEIEEDGSTSIAATPDDSDIAARKEFMKNPSRRLRSTRTGGSQRYFHRSLCSRGTFYNVPAFFIID